MSTCPSLVRQGQNAQRSDGIGEKGVWPVERIDVSFTIAEVRPARRLHRTAHFHGEIIERELPRILRDPPLQHQVPQVPIRADIIEAMIVHPDMADVCRHVFHGRTLPHRQRIGITGRIELQDRGTEPKALRPFGQPRDDTPRSR